MVGTNFTHKIVLQGKDAASGAINRVQKSVRGLGGALSGTIVTLNQGTQLIGSFARGLGSLANAMSGPVRAAIELERANTKINSTLRATGDAVGLTKQALDGMAQAQADVTGAQLAAVKSGQALLLTFTKIGGDVFPETLAIVEDMTAAFGSSWKEASIQLGKALNDPITGVSALKEVGVSFNEQQKRTIVLLQQQGDLYGAQKVILEELQREIGGTAAALGDTFAGNVNRLNSAWTDMQAAIGEFITDDPTVRGAIFSITNQFRDWTKEIRKNEDAQSRFREVVTLIVKGVIPAMLRGLGGLIRFSALAVITMGKLGEILQAVFKELRSLLLLGPLIGAAVDGLVKGLQNVGITLDDLPGDTPFFSALKLAARESSDALEVLAQNLEDSLSLEGIPVIGSLLPEGRVIEDWVAGVQDILGEGLLGWIADRAAETAEQVGETFSTMFEEHAGNWRDASDGFFAAFKEGATDAFLEPIFGAESAFKQLFEVAFQPIAAVGKVINKVIGDLISGFVTWLTTKKGAEKVAQAESTTAALAQQKIVAAGAATTIGAMMPGLATAAGAALVASFGSAGSFAALLPGILSASAAEGGLAGAALTASVALAEGGRITSPTLGLVGEAGDETVIPETRTGRARGLLADLLRRRPELAPASGGGISSLNVSVSIGTFVGDVDELADLLAPALDARLGGLTS